MAPTAGDAPKAHIVILGAGSIGCWVGGELALLGTTRVSFVHRDSPTGRAMRAAVCAHGLTLEIVGERGARTLPAEFCREAFTTDAAERLRSATAVLVVTKRHANPTVAPLLARLPASVPIYLLQNGLNAPAQMRELLSAHDVDAAERVLEQVVVAISATLVHAEGRVVRSGPLVELTATRALEPLADVLRAARIPTRLVSAERHGCELRGKLMLNMLNAPNALSGKPLGQLLLDRRACAQAAATMFELRAAYAALGLRVEPRRLRWLPFVLGALSLRAVSWALALAAALAEALTGASPLGSALSKSSTLESIESGRATEIGFLNGEVVRLGARARVPTPANEAALRAVRALELEATQAAAGRSADSPQLTANDLLSD